MKTDKNKHLECVLASHKISNKQGLLDKHISRRTEISEALTEMYGSKMYSMFNSGSYAKNTAVNRKFDFDLMAPFKRDSFDTLEKMFNDVYDFLYEKYRNEATVRKQKVSIGIEFFTDEDNDIVKVDIVPGRELNKDQYLQDDKLNLYVYSQFGSYIEGSERIQTNVKAQIENIRNNAEKGAIRQIIRLLKVWKIYNNKSVKSFFIEMITIKAFDRLDLNGDLWNRLKGVMEFIRDEVKTISLPDPGNSTINVADSLSDLEKELLSDDMKYMIDRIEDDCDNIKLFFKVNQDHPCEDKKDDTNKYGVKEEKASTPPPTRFG